MGVCCKPASNTDNEAENFIRETLANIKLRDMDFTKFKTLIESCLKSDGTITFPSWELLIGHIVDTSQQNVFSLYQKSILPSYSSKEKFIYELFVWAFSFISNTDDKYKGIIVILLTKYEKCSIENFLKFLDNYLTINIVENTNLIYNTIRRKYCDIRNYKLNKDFQITLSKLISYAFNETTKQLMLEQCLNYLIELTEKKIKKRKVKFEEYILEDTDVKIFYNYFSNIFDAIELRSDVFHQYNNVIESNYYK